MAKSGVWTPALVNLGRLSLFGVNPTMGEEATTAAVQRFLDALAGDTPPEPIVRELLDRAVRRLQLLSGAMLHRSYPRLTQPPLNLSTDELLGGVVAGLLTAMRTVRPRTVASFSPWPPSICAGSSMTWRAA